MRRFLNKLFDVFGILTMILLIIAIYLLGWPLLILVTGFALGLACLCAIVWLLERGWHVLTQ